MRGFFFRPWVAACGLLCAAGCASGVNTANFSSQDLPGISADEAFDASELVLRQEFGRVTASRRDRRIATNPVEYQVTSGSGSARDLYGGSSTLQRTAQAVISGSGENATVLVRVAVAREDTDRRTQFIQESYRFGDSPAATPVERDAATTARQNTVWTFVRRDVDFERELLARIADELDQSAAPPADGGAAGVEPDILFPEASGQPPAQPAGPPAEARPPAPSPAP